MMPAKQALSDDERALQALQHDVDERARAVRARLEGRNMGRDRQSSAHSTLKDGEPPRKMAPPSRRYWPSPNSQRAPSRPQAKKASSR